MNRTQQKQRGVSPRCFFHTDQKVLNLRLFNFRAIFQFMNSMLSCTIGTTVDDAIRLHTMPNNSTITMGAAGCQGVNGTFKTVKDMQFSVHLNTKTLVIRISADFTDVLLSGNKEIRKDLGFAFG